MARLIDADKLKDKFKAHYDLFAGDYKGEHMSLADKSRIDEILNSMAEVINAPTVCDIEQIRDEIKRVLMDLGTNNAYDMPSFWANKGKDYKVIPTKWHKGYGQAIVDVDNRLKELFDKYTK